MKHYDGVPASPQRPAICTQKFHPSQQLQGPFTKGLFRGTRVPAAVPASGGGLFLGEGWHDSRRFSSAMWFPSPINLNDGRDNLHEGADVRAVLTAI